MPLSAQEIAHIVYSKGWVKRHSLVPVAAAQNNIGAIIKRGNAIGLVVVPTDRGQVVKYWLASKGASPNEGRNLALAGTPNQFKVVSATFESLQQQRDLLAAECQRQEAANHVLDVESEVAAAMGLFERLTDLASDPSNLPAITKLFAGVDARLFLRFEKQQHGKRLLNRLVSGVLTLGTAPAPIETYSGPTSKKHLASCRTQDRSISNTSTTNPCTEGESLGNVNRGDMI